MKHDPDRNAKVIIPLAIAFIAALVQHTETDYPGKSFRVGNLLSNPAARRTPEH